MELPDWRTSTWAIVILGLILGAIASLLGFTYFAGTTASPVAVTVGSLDSLSVPPVIEVPRGDPPLNVTSPTYPFLPETEGHFTCYQYWYFFSASPPLHPANVQEPVFIVWDTSNVTGPVLVAIISRAHFNWVARYDNFILLNGTRVVVRFTSSTYHVPITGSTLLLPIISRGDYTTIFSYNVTVDPNAPYATGPQTYEPGAGPQDCFTEYHVPQNLNLGFTVGPIAGLAVFAFISGTGLSIRRLVELLF